MFGLTPYEKKSYDLFNVFHDFEKDFFNNTNLLANTFSTDIRDEGDKYVLEAELPGFAKDEISVNADDDYLTITAKHNVDTKDSSRYIRRERMSKSYSRSFGISNINTDEIKAAYSDGVLTLELPKKAEPKPRTTKIEIN